MLLLLSQAQSCFVTMPCNEMLCMYSLCVWLSAQPASQHCTLHRHLPPSSSCLYRCRDRADRLIIASLLLVSTFSKLHSQLLLCQSLPLCQSTSYTRHKLLCHFARDALIYSDAAWYCTKERCLGPLLSKPGKWQNRRLAVELICREFAQMSICYLLPFLGFPGCCSPVQAP